MKNPKSPAFVVSKLWAHDKKKKVIFLNLDWEIQKSKVINYSILQTDWYVGQLINKNMLSVANLDKNIFLLKKWKKKINKNL